MSLVPLLLDLSGMSVGVVGPPSRTAALAASLRAAGARVIQVAGDPPANKPTAGPAESACGYRWKVCVVDTGSVIRDAAWADWARAHQIPLQGAAGLLVSTTTSSSSSTPSGRVMLVGAGPGDPGLLTLHALRCFLAADVVLYDNLVSAAVLALVPQVVERVYVGKRDRSDRVPQHEINRMLVDRASAGARVLRLKGGDPYIFGRGGEEAEALMAAGLPFEVVPGITSAGAAACLHGLPLTHRDHAQSVAFVTGHRREGALDLAWTRHTSADQTLVVYMGVRQSGVIAAALLEAGRDPETPVAILERVSRPDARVHRTRLAGLSALVAEAGIQPPALLVIGAVAALQLGMQAAPLRNAAR